jgi:hypothetical protein
LRRTKAGERPGAVEEDLRLILFVAGDVFLTPRGEFREFFPARHAVECAPKIYQRQFYAEPEKPVDSL